MSPDLARAVAALPGLVAEIAALRTRLDDLVVCANDILAAVQAEVDAELVEVHPPVCPRCHGPLKLRRVHATGVRFLGCEAYPRCRGSADYSAWRREAEAELSRREFEMIGEINDEWGDPDPGD